MGTKKTAANKAPKAKKEKVAKAENSGAGRKSGFSGMKIYLKAKENPRRAGTYGHASFELIKNGMTYEDFVAAGGRPQDLAWDVNKGNVEVR